MGKLSDLDIQFEQPCVFAGHFLRGTVCFNLKESTKKIKSVILIVEGHTKVTIAVGDFGEEKKLLKHELNLSLYLRQFNNSRVPAGPHQIPFAFLIPQQAPSSFGDKFGYIFYCCKAVINDKTKIRKSFTIIGIEDLNWHPYAALPVTIKERSAAPFWALFNRWSSNNVNVLLQLERTAFVPGESIRINAEIINQTNKKVKHSSVQLKQGILYKTPNGRQKEICKILETVTRKDIHPGGVDRWEWEELHIPLEVPPSFLRGSDFITVKYELIFTVDPGVSFTVPIIIGTIPFSPENLKTAMQALPWRQESHYGSSNGMTTGAIHCPNAAQPRNRIYANKQDLLYGTNCFYQDHRKIYEKPPEKRVIKIEEID